MTDHSDPIATLGLSAPRLTTASFPPYHYIPGLQPHPKGATSKGAPAHAPLKLSGKDFLAEGWKACTPFVFGVDLYNHGFWWEAHEEWESVWKAFDAHIARPLVQVLILTAAIHLQVFVGKQAGVETLSKNWHKLWNLITSDTQHAFGVDLRKLRETCSLYWESGRHDPTQYPYLLFS
jgi:hypothetical protein